MQNGLNNLKHGKNKTMQKLQEMINAAWECKKSDYVKAAQLAQETYEYAISIKHKTGLQRCLVLMAQVEAINKNHTEAKALLRKSKQQAQAAGDWLCLAFTYVIHYIVARNKLDREKSLHYLRESITIHEQHNSFDLSGHRSLGRHYWEVGLYPEALEVLLKVDREAQACGAEYQRSGTWRLIAAVYHNMNDRDAAHKANLRSYEFARQNGNLLNEVYARASIATQELFKKNFKTAIRINEEVLESLVSIDRSGDRVKVLQNLSRCHLEAGNFESAMRCAQSCRREAQELNSFEYCNAGKTLIGEILMRRATPDLPEALKLLKEALALAEQYNLHSQMWQAHDLLAKLYTMLNDSKRAAAHKRKREQIHEDVRGEKIRQELNSIQMRYDLRQANAERELLRTQNSSLSVKVEQLDQELTKMALIITQKHAGLLELKREIAELERTGSGRTLGVLRTLSKTLENQLGVEPAWNQLEKFFSSVHESFVQNLAQLHPQLTPTELKVCILLKLGLSSKEIGEVLFLSSHTINTHRQRIRKKLGLERSGNLNTYLQQFGAPNNKKSATAK